MPEAGRHRPGFDSPILVDALTRKFGFAFFRVDRTLTTLQGDDAFYATLRRPEAEGPVAVAEIVGLFDTGASRVLLGSLQRAVFDRRAVAAVNHYRLADGSVRSLEWQLVCEPDGDLAGSLRDITDEVEARNLLEGQKELIANLVDHLPLPVAILNSRLRYVAVNRRWIEDFAIDASEGLVGRRHYDVFPNTPTHWRELHHLALNGERISRDLDEHERGDGARLTVNWVLQPWRDKTGGIGGIVIMAEILRLSRRFAERARGNLASILFGSEGGAPPRDPWRQAPASPAGDIR